MKNKTKLRQLIFGAIFWVILISSFVFFSIVIVLRANGYQLNRETRTLVQTGMIVLDGLPEDVKIDVGSTVLEGGFPQKVTQLAAGGYFVTITKEGYSTWQKMIRVQPGLASVYNNIVLFKKISSETPPPENFSVGDLTKQYQDQIDGLEIENAEIFYQHNLVTRFSDPVLAANLFEDRKHIVFQIKNEIRVIDLDGSNDVMLTKLSSEEPSVFTTRSNGSVLIYLDEETIKAKTIR